MSDLNLQTDFPDVTRDDWRALAEKGLRGAAFETLQSETEDGLRRGPLFDASDRPDDLAPIPRGDTPLLDGRAWHVCAQVMDADADYANAQLLDALKGGASAVRIEDVPLTRRADLRRLLEGVLLDLVPVVLAPNPDAVARADYALGIEELSASPVTLGLNLLDHADELPRIIDSCPNGWRAVTLDAALMHRTGGTAVMELALIAAASAEGFRRFGSEASHHIALELATDTDAHLSVCKLRAARRIYAAVADAFDAPTTVPMHAVTSSRMLQSADAWTNLLRINSAAFGAVVGGADYVTTRAFTEPLGGATPFANRIARNQQLLMMEESHLGQVRDAAHGSYFHERVTDDMAQAGWALFQQIEAQGGVSAWKESGRMNEMIVAAKAERADADAPILGVTLHAAGNDVPTPEVR